MKTRGVGTKKHVHWRMVVKEGNDSEESGGVYRNPNKFSVETCTDDLTSKFQFTEYVKHYAYYKDGDTEYIRFEGHLFGDKLDVTIDVFSCYCEPLNEGQEPPF